MEQDDKYWDSLYHKPMPFFKDDVAVTQHGIPTKLEALELEPFEVKLASDLLGN